MHDTYGPYLSKFQIPKQGTTFNIPIVSSGGLSWLNGKMKAIKVLPSQYVTEELVSLTIIYLEVGNDNDMHYAIYYYKF